MLGKRSIGAYLSAVLLVAELFIAATPLAQAQEPVALPAEIVPQSNHDSEIVRLVVSPDGRLALTVGIHRSATDARSRLWDIATGRLMRVFNDNSPMGWERFEKSWSPLAFAPDSRHALIYQSERLAVVDVATGRVISTLADIGEPVIRHAFSPSGRFVVGGTEQGRIGIWETRNGRRMRTNDAHAKAIGALAVSPDGNVIASGADEGRVKLWESERGRLIVTLEGHAQPIRSVTFSSDGQRLVTVAENVSTWDARRHTRIESPQLPPDLLAGFVALSSGTVDAEGRRLLVSRRQKDSESFGPVEVWDLATARLLNIVGPPLSHPRNPFKFLPGSQHLIVFDWIAGLGVYDVASGRLVRSIGGESERGFQSVKFIPGTDQLVGASGGRLLVWSHRSGQLIRELERAEGNISGIAVSTDLQYVAGRHSGDAFNDLAIWSLATGRIERRIAGELYYDAQLGFTADGRILVASGLRPMAWDLASGNRLGIFNPDTRGFLTSDGRIAAQVDQLKLSKGWTLWVPNGSALSQVAQGPGFLVDAIGAKAFLITCEIDPVSGHPVHGAIVEAKLPSLARVRELRVPSLCVQNVRLLHQGDLALVWSNWGDIAVWSLSERRQLIKLEGHPSTMPSLDASQDGHRIVSTSSDGTKIWALDRQRPLATLVGASSAAWISFTPEGFFTRGGAGGEVLAVSRGLESISIEQVHQSLYNPDLVREQLSGDPSGEVTAAARVINIDKVLASGPPPATAIISHLMESQSAEAVVRVKARIRDGGRGIGRIEWRLNRVTIGTAMPPLAAGDAIEVEESVALDPGENVIEVVAYDSANLIASLPARVAIRYTGAPDAVQPTLHVLAIGINAYTDQGWTPPGAARPVQFPPLSLAVKDAKAFGEALERAGAGLYADVRVTYALDGAASRAGLEREIERLSREVRPRDTFILFAAAHGTSEAGRFYLIPADYQGGQRALAERAIGQNRLQDWLANRIRAKKAVIMLDTCESGALVSGYRRSRTDEPASEAGVGRLHEATGRPVLTAAAEGQFAHEGVVSASGVRHGLFTWALLEALRDGDSDSDGLVTLSELVRHVQNSVPRLAADLNGRGKAAVAIPTPVFGRQTARFGSRGEDFPLARRLP